jgi:hypothetical protein
MTSSIAASSTLEFKGAGTIVSSEYRIQGLFASDPVVTTAGGTSPTTGVNQNNTELFIGAEVVTNDATNNRRRRVIRYHRNRTAPSWEVCWTDNATSTYAATSRPAACYFDQTGSNSAAPTSVGAIPIVFLFDADALRMFPSDIATTTTGTAALPNPFGTASPVYMMCHQNRAVAWVLATIGDGAGVVKLHSDILYWTNPNDLTTLDTELASNYANVLAYVEMAKGVEFATRMTADQLFIMKRAGGALVIQGDLNAFTAIPKVAVQSSGFSLCPGTFSPLGIVYPVASGSMYVWEGGDTSRDIAPWMTADFWRPTPASPANTEARSTDQWGYSHCQVASWQDWILTPNNFLFDTGKGGWWRLYETTSGSGASTVHTDMRRWAVDWSGRWCWGAPSGYSEATDTVLYEFDRAQPRESWSWQSHPQAATLVKQVSVNEITLWVDAQNTVSTVTVTVTSAEDTVGASQTVTIPVSDRVQAIRCPSRFRVNGTGVQVRLEANSNVTNTEAPRVHKLVATFDDDIHDIRRSA